MSSGVNLAGADPEAEEEARIEHAQLVTELKQQLQKAEAASEEYQRQAEVLRSRLDEVLKDHSILEEQQNQHESEVQSLQAEIKELTRQRREVEVSHETEKQMLLREREQQLAKEEQLESTIRRLNEAIRQRDVRAPEGSERGIQHNGLEAPSEAFAPGSPNPAEEPLAESHESSQKDEMIEGLRLELVEAQIKLAEMEHLGHGQVQELEKSLLHARVTNARLLEDNESYQLLLSEKTLKGDFMNDSAPAESGLGSLADELESAQQNAEGEGEAYKKLEGEVKSLRDSNKALTLYIDKIIGRLLQHEGFEHIIHEKDEPPAVPPKPAPKEKTAPQTPTPATMGQTLLQRARSVVSRPTAPKARPMSIAQPPTAHENPETAPSIPLKGHRRSRSDQAQNDSPVAAAVINRMYPGSPVRTISGGPTTQGISPALSPSLAPTRLPYFPPGNPTAGRAPSGPHAPANRGSSSNSVSSGHSGDMPSNEASSTTAQAPVPGMSNVPGAVMKQNQLRPLRLVREQAQNQLDEDEAKRANRASWFGFFKGASVEANQKTET